MEANGFTRWRMSRVVSLLATVLFTAGEYAGLGIGGMERLIVYPVLIWGAMFGASLSSSSQAP
jgi:hypothetical membrane protein